MRIGDGVGGGKSFTNGVGIKFHDAGVVHYSIGINGSNFKIANTSNNGNQLFPSGFTEGITIDTSGNVGIGNASPKTNLHVNHDVHIGANSSAWNTSAGKGIYMRYSTNGGQDSTYIQSIDRSANTFYPLQIEASKIILNQGNVGIGVASPTYKLHVDGYIKGTVIAFHAYNATPGDRTTTGVFPADIELYDYGDCYDTSTRTFTAPVNGIYHFWWYAYTNQTPSTNSRWFLFKNTNTQISHISQSGGTIEQGGQSYSIDVYLGAGDHVYLTGNGFNIYWYGAAAHNGWGCHLVTPV